MKKTGIFSGSFNPIHIGHLALANWICEYEELDELWFLVTPQNPLKKREDFINDQLRLEMVQEAISDYPKFKASDIEFHLPSPNYTINTLRTLEKKYPDRSWSFIIGADNWQNIAQWKDYKTLLSDYSILIYPRLGYNTIIPEKYPHIRAVKAPIIEISSTFIRESYKKGKDIRFFLPERIRDRFIKNFVY